MASIHEIKKWQKAHATAPLKGGQGKNIEGISYTYLIYNILYICLIRNILYLLSTHQKGKRENVQKFEHIHTKIFGGHESSETKRQKRPAL